MLIAGEGPDRERDRGLDRPSWIWEEIVTLLGGPRRHPRLPAALDVAVCSSDWEGSPLSVMEYMEAELPVVATRVGGIPGHDRRRGGGRAGAAGRSRGDRRGGRASCSAIRHAPPRWAGAGDGGGARSSIWTSPLDRSASSTRSSTRRRGGLRRCGSSSTADYSYHVEDRDGSAPRCRSRCSPPGSRDAASSAWS